MIIKKTPQIRYVYFFLTIPFCLFMIFVCIAFMRIIDIPAQTEEQMPNALIGKQAPRTILPQLTYDNDTAIDFDTRNFRGQVTLLNFWSSWCKPCRDEHAFLMSLADNHLFQIVGVNYKNTRDNALRFLGSFGNPFRMIGFDSYGRAAINWGVYGLPETFIIGKDNTVLYRHVGPLTFFIFNNKMMPLIIQANSL
ncbi:MAG: thiol:disulfide interchange protein DsbE [Candidatus Tokpelaia sp. JSC085]|nr:MAG: thiol:disulfide interchange protein DsbE [Candidatus Tokpelaia sp. JSC085]